MAWTKVLGKTVITTIAALWLAGCASHNPSNSVSGTQGNLFNGQGTTRGINDSAVNAVVRSGQINETPSRLQQLLSKNTYYFKFDSNAINPTDYDALNAQAVLLKTPEYKNVTLVVEGNTDQRGTRNYNMALGLRRATAVRDYLVGHGVKSSQVRVISYGFEKPADPENNPVAWAKNRRAHLVFQDKQGKTL